MNTHKPSRFERSRNQTERARELRKTASKTKRKLWLYLRQNRLGPKFRRQHPIGPFSADYYCVTLKLAIEVDGDWHNLHSDERRDAYFLSKGIHTLRIPAVDIDENMDGVLYQIEMKIAELEANQAEEPKR